MAKKWPKNGLKKWKIGQHGGKLAKMAKKGQNDQKMAKKLLKWPKKWPMWPINGQNDGKMAETAKKWLKR